MSKPPTPVDLRGLAAESRPDRVHGILLGLSPGDVAELIDDRDPNPMLMQLLRESPNSFTWDAGPAGDGVWRARLARAAAGGHGEGRCCGSCGGH
ncbi:DUF2249 domain-containing protein [Roseateles saccharophilus]|uniref:Uncharacterized protein (DUF2249 family) n=1 Tax=Roseateles saccharophilus TaxID=304 RepID=A0A4V2VR30_ROSSA|nr:DUF2249 domain-containing protein [Roseateles saccharophilus]MDG0832345.1 DUF2249 domain-containing protein [Roseateles saccharophilus]TCU97039.1 uncharacterized protein (DUF2249 family) [Roseateles saccharophilus]